MDDGGELLRGVAHCFGAVGCESILDDRIPNCAHHGSDDTIRRMGREG